MWHEARRSEKKVHDLMETARKRAMRRAFYLAKRRGDPHQSLQVSGARCRVHRDDGLYQAAEDQLGLIPWNGNDDNLIDRFDGRALLDFIREAGSRPFRAREKTEEEEELEEFVNFERYRDLIKHRRRGFSEEEGLQHVQNELEAKISAHLSLVKPQQSQTPSTKGSYSQVGFSYNGHSAGETVNPETDDEDDEEDDDDEFSSDDSDDEKMEAIAKDFGVKRYNWLVYKEKKDKEEEQRQKELVKGDPSIRKLSRRERRKLSQMERERERELDRTLGRGPHHDPYRDPRRSPSYDGYPRRRRSRSRTRTRSRSTSRSPSSYSRRHSHDSHRSSKSMAPKIEYITEFGGGSPLRPEQRKTEWISPPSSPVQSDAVLNRSAGSLILEALHSDPASVARTIEQEKTAKFVKAPGSTSGLSKLNRILTGGPSKNPAGEKKETPQERLKRIMSKQLNKQIKKDTAAEQAKKREQERERRERLAELSRLSRRSRSRSRSRSRGRSRNRDRSRGRSSSRSSSPPRRRRYSRSRSRSRSRSPRRYRDSPRSLTRRQSHTRSHTRSPSPRSRSRSKH